MRIRKLQVTLQPCRHPSIQDEYRDIKVEVIADGRIITTSHTIRNSDFEDQFGAMMRESEHLIRRSIKEAEVLREADNSIQRALPKNTP